MQLDIEEIKTFIDQQSPDTKIYTRKMREKYTIFSRVYESQSEILKMYK